MSNRKFLVTGASGCIGGWVLRHLLDRGEAFVASDLRDDRTRPGLLMSEAEVAGLDWLCLDVTDGDAVRAAVTDNAITHIVHLAGLQVPFARANPPLGAAVNVGGTINVLEAARHGGVKGLSYASSIAVFGPPEKYPDLPVPDDALPAPDTLYGVYKTANEETARVYWQDWQVGSVGLRPGVVYGVGRDQGLTSDIAKAILAVAAGRPFHIRFSGQISMQHAGDVAAMFIDTACAEHEGAAICNLCNDVVDVSGFVQVLTEAFPEAEITCEADAPLRFPSVFDDGRLRSILGEVPHTALADGIRGDVARLRGLLDRGLIDLGQLDA